MVMLIKSKKRAFLLLFAVLVLGLLSCSRSEPKILFGFIELVYYQGRDQPEERYSFFILPEDEDGVENLSLLYLYHDREGLRWLFTSEDWLEYEEDGKTWIGTRNIAMPGNQRLPRGQYRAVLVTKGGEETERRFTYDGPEIPPYPFPSFTITSGRYRINSGYPINSLIGYDQQGTPVQTIRLTENEGSVWGLRFSSSVRTAALWAEDPEFHISALREAAPGADHSFPGILREIFQTRRAFPFFRY